MHRGAATELNAETRFRWHQEACVSSDVYECCYEASVRGLMGDCVLSNRFYGACMRVPGKVNGMCGFGNNSASDQIHNNRFLSQRVSCRCTSPCVHVDWSGDSMHKMWVFDLKNVREKQRNCLSVVFLNFLTNLLPISGLRDFSKTWVSKPAAQN